MTHHEYMIVQKAEGSDIAGSREAAQQLVFLRRDISRDGQAGDSTSHSNEARKGIRGIRAV